MSIIKKKDINVSERIDVKMILEPFNYSKEYNSAIKANCI